MEAPIIPRRRMKGETQKRVFSFVRERDVVTIREIAEGLSISLGCARFHVRNLEYEGLMEQRGKIDGRAAALVALEA